MQQIYGNWKVIKQISPLGTKHHKYLCECLLCNNLYEVFIETLKQGTSTRCRPCKLKETHGLSNTPTYRIWTGIFTRCYNQNHRTYKHYGAKGIKICERWKNFTNFLADMGERPKGYQIDRIDPERDYEPSNCRWISKKENCQRIRTNLKDVTGQRFGKWTVIKRDDNYPNKNHAYFVCKCDCGVESSVMGSLLRRKRTTQCKKCKNELHKGWGKRYKKNNTKSLSNLIDISGQKIGNWIVLERDHNKGQQTYFKCECECGAIQSLSAFNLRRKVLSRCKMCKQSLSKKNE